MVRAKAGAKMLWPSACSTMHASSSTIWCALSGAPGGIQAL